MLQGVEKTIVSKMLVDGSNRRTYAVDRHAGIVSRAAAGISTLQLRAAAGSGAMREVTELLCPLQAVAGVAADGRQAVNRSISEAQNYKR
jgi:hypothetical protein